MCLCVLLIQIFFISFFIPTAFPLISQANQVYAEDKCEKGNTATASQPPSPGGHECRDPAAGASDPLISLPIAVPVSQIFIHTSDI